MYNKHPQIKNYLVEISKIPILAPPPPHTQTAQKTKPHHEKHKMNGVMIRNVLLRVPTSATDTANLVLNYNGNKRYLEAVL